jgi:hypothetical protein
VRLHTTSEVISYSKKLEMDSAIRYRQLAGAFLANTEVLNSFARENEKFIIQVQRAYNSVISDAIEGAFAFDLESDDYMLDTTSFSGTVNKIAATMEKTMIKFYTDAARQSESLMADVPVVFKQVVKKREGRMEQIKELI